MAQQTATPQNGLKYVRITSNGSGMPNPSGYMTINGTAFTNIPGVPYTLKPTSITGYVKTNLNSGDTAYIFGSFRKNRTTTVGSFIFPIFQNYSNWTQVTIPINYSNVNSPDTIQLNFVANKAIMGKTPCSNGAFLEIDNFMLTTPTDLVNLNSDIKEFSLFPNPTNSNLIFISSSSNFQSYQISNTIGEIVKKGNYTNELDVNELKSGIYYLQLVDEKKNVITKKFVVTR